MIDKANEGETGMHSIMPLEKSKIAKWERPVPQIGLTTLREEIFR